MRLGIITYTNLASGIGLFGYEFWKYLEADSILSVPNKIKGQDTWTDRQLTLSHPPGVKDFKKYIEQFEPDTLLFLETPFSHNLYRVARGCQVKTVGIPMHESRASVGMQPDLLICTSHEAWRKSNHSNKRLMFLPIGLELFPYKKRTGHTFIHNIGYGGVHDRRQTTNVVKAFQGLQDPKARLILRTQRDWPEGSRVKDKRITYIKKNYPNPADVYADGDIAIAPMAYGGYERIVLEAMASGLPVLTTDADPMNLFQHDPDLLVEPCRQYEFSEQWVVETIYNEVSVEDLREKMEWLLTIDTAAYSEQARRQAEAQSWESESISYKSIWNRELR